MILFHFVITFKTTSLYTNQWILWIKYCAIRANMCQTLNASCISIFLCVHDTNNSNSVENLINSFSLDAVNFFFFAAIPHDHDVAFYTLTFLINRTMHEPFWSNCCFLQWTCKTNNIKYQHADIFKICNKLWKPHIWFSTTTHHTSTLNMLT